MPLGFTTVSATQLQDATGTPIDNATISFEPVANNGYSISFRTGLDQGQVTAQPVSAQVANGKFSLQLADTSLTTPVNVGYRVTVTDNLTGRVLLGYGYDCVQPSGSTWSFDTFVPNVAAQVTVLAGPVGQSAYQTWLATGETGTEEDFLASLRGQIGNIGPVGPAATVTLVNGTSSDGPITSHGLLRAPAQETYTTNVDATGKVINLWKTGIQATGHYRRMFSWGGGVNQGNAGGWSNSKVEDMYTIFAQRGITQGYGVEINKSAVGDCAGMYTYVNADAGVQAESDEGVHGAQFEVVESAGQLVGTVLTTSGVGDIHPTLSKNDGVAQPYLIDGAFLLNISKGTIASALTGPSVSGPIGGFGLNYFPVPDNALPLTTAWATISQAAVNFQGQAADNPQPNQMTVSIQAINGVRVPLKSGIAMCAGNSYCEQAKIVANATDVSADGLTQVITLYVRNSNWTMAIFQGGIAGQYLSMDASLSITGQRTCYYAFGSLTGKDLIYGIVVGGQLGYSLPWASGNMPWATSGANAGFHLYPGAEIVANGVDAHADSSDTIKVNYTPNLSPTLEANAVNWAVGDVIENPKYPVQGGNGIGLLKTQHTASDPSKGSYGLSLAQNGWGITSAYSAINVVNLNSPSMYAGRGTNATLTAPALITPAGDWSSFISAQYAPGPGESIFVFGNLAGGQQASAYAGSPISVIGFKNSPYGTMTYAPDTATFGFSYLLVQDQLTVDGQFKMGIGQAAGLVPQGGGYGRSWLLQPQYGGTTDIYTDPNGYDGGKVLNGRTWNNNMPFYYAFNDGGNLKWIIGKNADNSFTIVDESTGLEILHANSDGKGFTTIVMPDTTNGHTYKLQIVNGVPTATQIS